MPSTPVRKDTKAGRFYSMDGEDYPSVTHVLSCLAKPALINWAANQERALVLEAACGLYDDCAKLPTPLSRPSFLASLTMRLGQQKAHQKALAKGSTVGSEMHGLIEWELHRRLGFLPGPRPTSGIEAQRAFQAWVAWADGLRLVPYAIEQQIYSRTHRFAGTFDLIADVEDTLTLLDWKSGKAIYAEAHLQNVAYRAAVWEMAEEFRALNRTPPWPMKPTRGMIVRLDKFIEGAEADVAVVGPHQEQLPAFLAIRQAWEWWHAEERKYHERRGQV